MSQREQLALMHARTRVLAATCDQMGRGEAREGHDRSQSRASDDYTALGVSVGWQGLRYAALACVHRFVLALA